ncbi:HU family DNA-binding protein, partial [bacterium]|nr:HU family DNA-binding protein [bacterium]
MTKSELLGKLAAEADLSKKQVEAVLTALVDVAQKSIKKGDPVKLPGFGILRLRKMKARMGRNPQTGEAIKIPARKKVGFTVSKAFKDSVL